MPRLDVLAFDADDTLWQNESLYHHTQTDLADLLAPYGIARPALEERLYQTESRNIGMYGYGIKSFCLSMIETAVDLTSGRISAREVQAILDLAKAQLNAPVELLPYAKRTVARLTALYPLMIITKGEPQEQGAKLQRSGLADFFPDVEVVADKTAQSYAALFDRRGLAAERLLMVGNALRSDILPILELGGHAVYIPHPLTWQHEAAEPPAPGTPRFFQIEHLGRLPALLDRLACLP
jgi:putative hydrolase of the HAD superfamily